jgi:hypothetical protein
VTPGSAGDEGNARQYQIRRVVLVTSESRKVAAQYLEHTIPFSSELDRSKYCFRIIDLSLSIPIIRPHSGGEISSRTGCSLTRDVFISKSTTIREDNAEMRNWPERARVRAGGVRCRFEPRKFECCGTTNYRKHSWNGPGSERRGCPDRYCHCEAHRNWLNSCSGYGSSGSVRAGRTPDRTLSGRGPCARFPEVPAARNLIGCQRDSTVSIHLKVGAETQQVEVRADAALVQSTVSSLGETVMEHEILDLPLDGRNFSQLGLLQPGVVPLTPGLLEAGGPARGSGVRRERAATGIKQFSDRRRR